jgi:ubiquinone/menaquinone biosynthesis C-methylase UbiE
MAKMFPEVIFYAVDTAEHLSTAKLRHIPKNVCIQTARDGLDHLPFSDQSFDYVMCRFLSFRIFNWRSLVDEMVRLTKPGWFVFY